MRGAAAITFSAIKLTLPTAAPAAVSGGAGILSPTRECTSRRRFTIRVRGSHPRVTVAGKRVRVRKGRAVIDLRGMPKRTVKVKVVAKRKGKTVRETRVYQTCTARSASRARRTACERARSTRARPRAGTTRRP